MATCEGKNLEHRLGFYSKGLPTLKTKQRLDSLTASAPAINDLVEHGIPIPL